jgi:hypothetical protein
MRVPGIAVKRHVASDLAEIDFAATIRKVAGMIGFIVLDSAEDH